MLNTDLATYKNLYLQTAREHIADLKKNLLLLNHNPQNQLLVYEVFRLFHSLKSQNYFMGFKSTGNYCKTLETFFRKIKDRSNLYHPAIANLIFEAILLFENSLNRIEKTNNEIDLTLEIINLEKRLGLQ